MLHKNPELVLPKTILLIQHLQALPELKEFYLVGGTALTLQLGHRNSIDIDLFTQTEFDTVRLFENLSSDFEIIKDIEFKNTLMCRINHIKTDFIRHNYAFVNPPITEEGITFLSLQDIAAMKMNVITQSGKRLKDFIDLYFLLQHFSLSAMIEFYKIKYPNANPLIPLRAVNYFDDIDPSIDPPKLLKPLPLEQIIKRIREATLKPDMVF